MPKKWEYWNWFWRQPSVWAAYGIIALILLIYFCFFANAGGFRAA